jgi:hypothetical protein
MPRIQAAPTPAHTTSRGPAGRKALAAITAAAAAMLVT